MREGVLSLSWAPDTGKQTNATGVSLNAVEMLDAWLHFLYSGKLCNRPLGMQSGGIRNAAITSSSRWDNKHGPYLARLHNKRKGSYMGSWTARMQNAYQWLQIDLKKPHKVVRISTQGSSSDNRWVTSYYLLYSQYGVYFAYYYQRNVKRVGLFLLLVP